jgi:hypothetical protein
MANLGSPGGIHDRVFDPVAGDHRIEHAISTGALTGRCRGADGELTGSRGLVRRCWPIRQRAPRGSCWLGRSPASSGVHGGCVGFRARKQHNAHDHEGDDIQDPELARVPGVRKPAPHTPRVAANANLTKGPAPLSAPGSNGSNPTTRYHSNPNSTDPANPEPLPGQDTTLQQPALEGPHRSHRVPCEENTRRHRQNPPRKAPCGETSTGNYPSPDGCIRWSRCACRATDRRSGASGCGQERGHPPSGLSVGSGTLCPPTNQRSSEVDACLSRRLPHPSSALTAKKR